MAQLFFKSLNIESPIEVYNLSVKRSNKSMKLLRYLMTLYKEKKYQELELELTNNKDIKKLITESALEKKYIKLHISNPKLFESRKYITENLLLNSASYLVLLDKSDIETQKDVFDHKDLDYIDEPKLLGLIQSKVKNEIPDWKFYSTKLILENISFLITVLNKGII